MDGEGNRKGEGKARRQRGSEIEIKIRGGEIERMDECVQANAKEMKVST